LLNTQRCPASRRRSSPRLRRSTRTPSSSDWAGETAGSDMRLRHGKDEIGVYRIVTNASPEAVCESNRDHSRTRYDLYEHRLRVRIEVSHASLARFQRRTCWFQRQAGSDNCRPGNRAHVAPVSRPDWLSGARNSGCRGGGAQPESAAWRFGPVEPKGPLYRVQSECLTASRQEDRAAGGVAGNAYS